MKILFGFEDSSEAIESTKGCSSDDIALLLEWDSILYELFCAH